MKTNSESIYIHIPFCNSICTYCDFPKLQYFRFLAEKYVSSLEEQVKQTQIDSENIKTIYIGGGTPTSLDDDLFEKVLLITVPFKNVEEFTVECNPESLSESKLLLMKKYGVNRLSIGFESTNNKVLKEINRLHTYEMAVEKFNLARSLGFNNINIDLILGLPHVSQHLLKTDIENILKLKPEHLSAYSLIVSPNTKMYLDGVNEASGDEQRKMYDLINNILVENGFEHYEISNWAKNEHYSKHNLTYWKDKEYYGFGLGAAGYINNIRYTNTKSINEYINHNYIYEKEEINKEDDEKYYLMLNLRTMFGIDLNEYKKLYNISFEERYKAKIDSLLKQKLAILGPKSFHLTYEGMMILDSILLDL